MFYSHEILTSRQYGVSTIWLVATVGNKSCMSRKSIQKVNIKQAVHKIIHPGAPLALRLQGSLLYGVTRVFSKQCHYMLDDTEKVQAAMQTFTQMMKNQTNISDPKVCKTSRKQIVLQDDPTFNIDDFSLPQLTLLQECNSVNDITPSATQRTFLSPAPTPTMHIPSSIYFDIPQTPNGSSYLHRLPGLDSSMQKPVMGPLYLEGEELLPIDDFGIEIGPDGNFIERDPNVHVMPSLGIVSAQQSLVQNHGHQSAGEQGLANGATEPHQVKRRTQNLDLEDETWMQDSSLLESENFATTTLGHDSSVAVRNRKRLRRDFTDNVTSVPRSTLQQWSQDYLTRCKEGLEKRSRILPAKARANAYMYTFGHGLGNLGDQHEFGVSPPLADVFTGLALQTWLSPPGHNTRTGGVLPSPPHTPELPRKHRLASEVFGGEQGRRDHRRRRRLSPESGTARRTLIHSLADWGADETTDSILEVGRADAQRHMDDHFSSSLMPWSRTGSILPSSSIKRGPNSSSSRQQQTSSRLYGRMAPSPLTSLAGRRSTTGRMTPDQDRYDVESLPDYRATPASQRSIFGTPHTPPPDQHREASPSLGLEGSLRDMLERERDKVAEAWVDEGTAEADTDAFDFITYLQEQALIKGQLDEEVHQRSWVNFEMLATPEEHTREIAVQAFYHTLTLANKGRVTLKQNATSRNSFAPIFVGVSL